MGATAHLNAICCAPSRVSAIAKAARFEPPNAASVRAQSRAMRRDFVVVNDLGQSVGE
jgi:hypothetical protein